jgi:asparagine synthase (glutamine-hydrolysing)
VKASDLPVGLGDMYASLYLLCKAIREHSTVALSGESADELFGGYRQFHDPAAQRAHTYPWLALDEIRFAGADAILVPGLAGALDLADYRRTHYEDAIAEVEHLDSESDLESRMRVSSYLHLTRFVRYLLDRKDRMSMAVGLEVRVPFCDHRLVEYVYNAPWALKTYDGREKSLLRGAGRDLLPRSVAERVKSPYPSTQDWHYVNDIQEQARELLSQPDHDVFSLVDPAWVRNATGHDPAQLDGGERQGLEWTLNLATWFDLHHPALEL